MSFLPAPLTARPDAILARVAPVTRIVAGSIWLVAAVITGELVVEARLCGLAIAALVLVSGLELRLLPRRLLPVLVAALGIGLAAALGNAANTDPGAQQLVAAGPLRLTLPALSSGLALALRLTTMALTSLLVFGPTDTTRFADSLVQQWHLPDRVAYGTLAAIGLAPMLAADWTAIGAARRLRGLAPRSLPGRIREALSRLLVLLVSAIRRAERIAIAMDARGFDSGVPRSRYRIVRLGPLDAVVIAAAGLLAVVAFVAGR